MNAEVAILENQITLLESQLFMLQLQGYPPSQSEKGYQIVKDLQEKIMSTKTLIKCLV